MSNNTLLGIHRVTNGDIKYECWILLSVISYSTYMAIRPPLSGFDHQLSITHSIPCLLSSAIRKNKLSFKKPQLTTLLYKYWNCWDWIVKTLLKFSNKRIRHSLIKKQNTFAKPWRIPVPLSILSSVMYFDSGRLFTH